MRRSQTEGSSTRDDRDELYVFVCLCNEDVPKGRQTKSTDGRRFASSLEQGIIANGKL